MIDLAPALEAVGLAASTRYVSLRAVGAILEQVPSVRGRVARGETAGRSLVRSGVLPTHAKAGSVRRVVAVADLAALVASLND